MDAEGIRAFKDWSDSMVMVSKVDLTKAPNIIDFINQVVDSAFGAQPPEGSTKTPQEYSTQDKKAAIAKQNEGKPAAPPKAAPQKQAQIDISAIESAIKNAFLNIEVQTIKAGVIIKDN